MTVDLRTSYLGLELKNPLVASASPLTGTLDKLEVLERAGISAMVLPSLFEEQIEHEEMELAKLQDYGAEGFSEALSYFPAMKDYRVGCDDYLRLIEAGKKALSVPVIGSLNGVSTGGWLRYAKKFEEAGADAVELNIYYLPTDPALSSEQVEQSYVDIVQQIRKEVAIPLAVKIGPYFSALLPMARKLQEAGADGLVLFNRFMQPDIDVESLEVEPDLQLSSPHELRLPLRWIAILSGRVKLSLAATTGIHRAQDLIKALLVGADVGMMTSALFRYGPKHPEAVLRQLQAWMEENEYESVAQLKGSMSHQHSPDPEKFERANYMKVLINYSSEIG